MHKDVVSDAKRIVLRPRIKFASHGLTGWDGWSIDVGGPPNMIVGARVSLIAKKNYARIRTSSI